MWPDHPIEFVQLPEDPTGIHFGLYVSHELISVISLFINQSGAQFRKFATKNSEQGKGYGSILLQHLLAYCSTQSIQRIWCNARIDKTDYYKKFGFTETDITYVKGGIDFVVIELVSHANS